MNPVSILSPTHFSASKPNPEPTEIIDTKKNWLKRSNELPGENRSFFERQINELFSTISRTNNQMSLWIASADAMSKVDRIASDFFERCRNYDAAKETTEHYFKDIAEKIAACRVQFNTFIVPVPTLNVFSAYNDLKNKASEAAAKKRAAKELAQKTKEASAPAMSHPNPSPNISRTPTQKPNEAANKLEPNQNVPLHLQREQIVERVMPAAAKVKSNSPQPERPKEAAVPNKLDSSRNIPLRLRREQIVERVMRAAEKVKNNSLQSQKPKEAAPSKPDTSRNIIFEHEREQLVEGVKCNKAIARGIKNVTEGLAKGVVAVCRSNDTVHRVCRAARDKLVGDIYGTALLLDRTPIPDVIKSYSNWNQRRLDSEAEYLAVKYNLPRETMQRHVRTVESNINALGGIVTLNPSKFFQSLGNKFLKPIASAFRKSTAREAASFASTSSPLRMSTLESSTFSVEERIIHGFNQFKEFGEWNSREQVWLKAASQTRHWPNGADLNSMKVTFIKDRYDSSIAKLGDRFIVKDAQSFFMNFVRDESMGLRYLGAEGLKNLRTPVVFVNGTYTNLEKRFFLLKEYIPGRSLEEMLCRTGNTHSGSQKHKVLMNECALACNAAGKALGEFHSTTSRLHVEAKEIFKQHTLASLEDKLIDTNRYLADLPGSLRIRKGRGFKSIEREFQQSPGYLSRGVVGDMHLGQFVWDNRKLTLIDGEFVTKNLISPIKELYSFRSDLANKGYPSGLTRAEISRLQRAFDAGYIHEFGEARTYTGAIRLFDTHYSIDTAGSLAFDIVEGGNVNRKFLVDLVERLDSALK